MLQKVGWKKDFVLKSTPVLPISGWMGDNLLEQSLVKPGEEVVFLPTHSVSNSCGGKVFTVEMHHKKHDQGCPGDNIGMNVKGLDKGNMPRTGDVMVYKKDTTLGACANFAAQIQVLDIPGEIQKGC